MDWIHWSIRGGPSHSRLPEHASGRLGLLDAIGVLARYSFLRGVGLVGSRRCIDSSLRSHTQRGSSLITQTYRLDFGRDIGLVFGGLVMGDSSSPASARFRLGRDSSSDYACW